MEADDIRLGQQLVQGYVSAVFCFQGLVGVLVKGQYLHPKGLGNLRRPLANPSKADYAEVLARQLHQGMFPETPVLVVGPLSCLDAVGMLAHMMAQLQKKGHCILGHRIRPIGGDVGNHHALFLGSRRINHIIPGCQDTDKFHSGALAYGLCRNRRFIGIHGLGIPNPLRHLVCRGPVIHGQGAKGLKPLPA